MYHYHGFLLRKVERAGRWYVSRCGEHLTNCPTLTAAKDYVDYLMKEKTNDES